MNVSIVIPVYNEVEYIAQCLECLVNQEDTAEEIIVVDNNSTDNTVQIVKQFPQVTLIHEQKQGMIPARNAGFEAAQYEVIARCDADALPPKNWIKKIKENFSYQEIDALSGPIVYYDLIPRLPQASQVYIEFFKQMQKHHVMIGPNMALTKTIWNNVKNELCTEDKAAHEDIDLAIHINEIGGRVHIDKSLIMEVSARRLKNNPLSFFIEYPVRFIKMLQQHKNTE